MALTDMLFDRLIRKGQLRIIGPDGQVAFYGDGTGANLILRLHDWKTVCAISFDPALAAGEAYMDGRLTIESGSLFDVLDLIFRNWSPGSLSHPLHRTLDGTRKLIRRLSQFNPLGRAMTNVAHHYDLSGRLYDLFLDADRQYSCAYVRDPSDTIETAQAQKKRHIAAKLLLKPHQSLLDIGSGWGGLALYLAQVADADVTGLTLSREQHRIATERATETGLADHLRFKLQDYRSEHGHYDRIVSVGMFEHVGINHYRDYFRMIARCLKDDGIALVHSIGRAEGPGYTNPWITKYVFPGGYCPALSEVIPAIEEAGLFITDIEILRRHYAETLRMWREAFNKNRDQIRDLYDERFCRMWEFYLVTSELAFRYQGQMVFQIQLAKSSDAVPITRDYITDFEATHAVDSKIAARNDYSRAA